MKRILIADDIEENLYLLRALLEGHGYAVDQARNGSEALVKALAQLPDMIITDILMPVIDGFTLCRIWKSDERLARVPFIFYTATYTDPRDEHLALDMGADAFIIKPTEPADFIRHIERVLSLGMKGNMAAPRKPKAEKEAILKSYNEALVRKLEQKMLGLEQANRELEEEISARHKVEAALRESEERYRLLFENSMDGVLLTEPNGTILSANPEASRMFGKSEDEIRRSGRNGVIDAKDLRLSKALEERERTGRFCGELAALRSDGSPFPCEVSSALFKDSEGNLKTSMVIRDITERKKAEEKIIAALREKEALLREIHHRVRNNMQVISSMISLQLQAGSRGMTAEEVTETSRDLQNRILSMALVHDMLYESKHFSRIDFNDYVHRLVKSLFNMIHVQEDRISTFIDIAVHDISITTAIPLGLIINELLTNTLKHAFPSGRKGEVRITMTLDNNDEYIVTVSDNGIGIQDTSNSGMGNSFGMQLVSILAKQLNASMSIHNNNGVSYSIRFTRSERAYDLALFDT